VFTNTHDTHDPRYEVKGAGSEEAGMIKSIGSVFEGNVIGDSMLGHAFNLCP
jgi:hypothetical protein